MARENGRADFWAETGRKPREPLNHRRVLDHQRSELLIRWAAQGTSQ